jgi:TRAP-type C4-dicarboxylate transport system permease small subunit
MARGPLRRLDWLEVAIGLLLVGLVVVVFAQVALRYLTYQPLAWTEEVARYLFIWLSLLGAAAGGRRGAHFAVDFLARRTPGPAGQAFRAALRLVEAVFYAVLAGAGIQVTRVAHLQRSASTDLPMSIPYAVIPIAAVLLCLACLRQARAEWAGTPEDPAP